MSEQSTQELTEENAAFVAVQKVATANVVATTHHPMYEEGHITREGIAIYVVVQPEGPDINEDFISYVRHTQKLKELEASMCERAGISDDAQLWYANTRKITARSIETIFEAIKASNSIIKAGGYRTPSKNYLITVVTKRHA